MASHPTKNSESLGERLKRRREALNLTAENVAAEIQAPLKYIYAFEADDYRVFSAKVYALGFFKKILVVLACEDAAMLTVEFGHEWDIQRFRSQSEIKSLPENRGKTPYVTPLRVGIVLLGLCGLFILFFFGYRFAHFLLSPKLIIVEPKDHSQVFGPVIHVKGMTEKESRLTMNGREVNIGERGDFVDSVELGAGLNILEFIVKNRFGKIGKETRAVLVK